MAIYRRFQDGMPWYLARYYWWAYLWDKSIWFFDHQPIINAILFGNYRKLQAMTLPHVTTNPMHQVLQLTCVYGELTGKLLERLPQGMFIADACVDQLKLALRKTANRPNPLHATRLNAESLSYADNSFDQIIVFFLFHEMPHDARERCIAEIARTLRPGGSLILTEYAPLPEAGGVLTTHLCCQQGVAYAEQQPCSPYVRCGRVCPERVGQNIMQQR